MRRRSVVFALAALVLSFGCKEADDGFAPAVGPTSFAFEGRIEPKLVGTWKTGDGASSVELSKDGGLKAETISRSVLGKNVVDVAGEWRVSGDSLVFRYVDKSRASVVLKYTATLLGNKLTLRQAGGRVTTTYTRK